MLAIRRIRSLTSTATDVLYNKNRAHNGQRRKGCIPQIFSLATFPRQPNVPRLILHLLGCKCPFDMSLGSRAPQRI
jgi:hypothetical protein